MKSVFNFISKLVIPLVVLFLTSCNCKDSLKIIVINASYHNIPSYDWCLVIKTEKGNLSNRLDTLVGGELSYSNNYTAEIFVFESKYDYLLYLQNNHHMDTISNFSVKTDRCNQIKDYNFYFNGVKKEKNETLDVYY